MKKIVKTLFLSLILILMVTFTGCLADDEIPVGKTYTIRFDTSGGTVIESIVQEYNTDIIAPEDPVKEGHDFLGWDKTIPTKMPARNMVISAKWKVNQYTITFDTAGGNEIAPISGDYGTKFKAPANPEREGYIFMGWDQKLPATIPGQDLHLTASWELRKEIVTFDSKGGSKVPYQNIEYGGKVTVPEEPTKTGYTFTGWMLNGEAFDFENYVVTGDVTVTASWKINQYTISFDTDGGSDVESITADYNSVVMAPAAPTKAGYTFIGWETDIPTKMPAEDVVIKALWKVNQYAISFDTDGGSAVESIVADYNSEVAAPTEPTKVGHTFLGWSPELPATMPVDGLNVKALWKVNQYTISFDTDGGSAVESIVADYNSEVVAPTEPTKVGHTFLGWSPELPATMPVDGLNVKALWKVNQYTISFDVDGVVTNVTGDYASAVEAPADPEKTGYTFTGWDSVIPATFPAENKTLKATWKINQYTISFDVDGVVTNVTGDYASAVEAPADPEKTGYTFAGWDSVVPATFPAENKTLKATWDLVNYTISYDCDGGSYGTYYATREEMVAAFIADFNSFANPDITNVAGYWSHNQKSGFWKNKAMHAKWSWIFEALLPFAKAQGQSRDYLNYMLAETPTIYGYATQNVAIYLLGINYSTWSSDYKATYGVLSSSYTTVDCTSDAVKDSWKAYVCISNTYTIESSKVYLPTPTKEGYDFAGWYNGENKFESIELGTTGNITLVAKWTPKNYTVEFNTDGGSVVDSITQGYGSVVVLPTPTKEGHTFAGWYDGETLVESLNMPLNGVTLKAQWTINEYTYTFYDGESVLKQETVKYGETITTPDAPTKFGYTFDGWSLTVDGEKVEVPETMPAKALDLYARWLEGVYSITFDTDGGSNVENINGKAGSVVVAPSEPTKEGYTFVEWSPALPATMPDENITVKAIWQVNKYTISFDTDGGSNVESIVADYKAAVVAPSEPTKEGYTFAGWDQEIPATMPLNGLQIKAKWDIVNYTISYDANGGSIPTQYASIDAVIADLVADYNTARGKSHTVSSFVALGSWSEISDASLFLYNATYRAKWTWLVNYIASVAGTANKSAWEAFNSCNSQGELNTLDTNYIYSIAYELRGFAGQFKYTKNSNYHTADYSDATISNKVWEYVVRTGYNVETPTFGLVKATKVGYNFDGWYNGETKVESIELGTYGNLELKAKWTPTNYTITYEGLAGATHPELITSYTIESATIVLPDASQISLSGATFGGWYLENTFETKVTSIEQGSINNITLYAYWIYDSVTEYTITSADATVLGSLSANIVVFPALESGKYKLVYDGNSYGTYTLGVDAFVSISAAIAVASEEDIIYVSNGTYTDELTISVANLTLVGPNYGIKGQATRNAEAVIDGLSNINGNGVVFNGLKHTKAIKVGANNVTITNCYIKPTATVACNGANRQGCIVDSKAISNLTVSNCYIDVPGTANSYTTQFMSFGTITTLTIDGNYITNSGHVTKSGSYAAMRIYNVAGVLNITNNEFRWGTTGYLLYIGTYSNTCTAINFIDNIMDHNGKITYTAGVMINKGSSSLTFTAMGNDIYNCDGSTFMFNGNSGSTVKIMYNNFGAGTKYKVGTSTNVKATHSNNFYVESINADSTIVPTDTTTYATVEAMKTAYLAYKESN